jgi:hypothetical protein
MPTGPRADVPKLVGILLLAALAGIPLTGFLWDVVSDLLAGHVNGARLALAAPLALVFAFLLRVVGRQFVRLAAPVREPGQPSPDEPEVSGTLFLTALIVMLMFGIWIVLYVMLLGR